MVTKRQNSNQALAMAGANANFPVVARKFVEVIRTAAITTASTYQVSKSVDISNASKVHILVKLTATAAGNIVSIVPEVCADLESDNFYPLSVFDAVVAADLIGNPTGQDGSNFGGRIVRPMEFKTPAIDTNADVFNCWITVDVPFGRAFRVQVAPDVGTPTVEIGVALSA